MSDMFKDCTGVQEVYNVNLPSHRYDLQPCCKACHQGPTDRLLDQDGWHVCCHKLLWLIATGRVRSLVDIIQGRAA